MKQFKLAATLFLSTSLLSSTIFANVLFKDEVTRHNWTGFYAGLNAGAVKHTMNMTDDQATSFLGTIQQVSNPKVSGGFQLGYRRQLDLAQVSGVYGLELSANFSDATFNKEYGSPFALYQLTSENELKEVCLMQLTGGIAADKMLLFLAAGLSWTNITGSVTNIASVTFFNSFNVNQKTVGTAVGGGIEYAFNDKISARLKVDVITPSVFSVNDGAGNTFQISNSIVQGTLGVNYKFA